MTITHAPFSSAADIASHLTQTLAASLLNAYHHGKEITQQEVDSLRQTVETLFNECEQSLSSHVAALEKQSDHLSTALSVYRPSTLMLNVLNYA